MAAVTNFEAGQITARAGLPASSNPHCCGYTKLGAVRLTEAGIDWASGWQSAQPARIASAAEVAAARSVDVLRFRRKTNRLYK